MEVVLSLFDSSFLKHSLPKSLKSVYYKYRLTIELTSDFILVGL